MRDCFVGAATWRRSSFNDYPGKPAIILFFGGCNLRCPYCHNPHIVFPDESKIEPFNAQEFWMLLEKRQGLLKGVVFSGGEPTLYPQIKESFNQIRSMGYAIKLDTNGMLPEMIREFSPDYLALDVKSSPEKYSEYLMAPFKDVQRRLEQSVDIVRKMKTQAEIRITAAPGIIDEKTIRLIGELIDGVEKVFIQPMQCETALLDPSYAQKPLPSIDLLNYYRDILSEKVGMCLIRGATDLPT